ncbi:MAG: glycosyltransferase, partial [Candidatus Thermoplasmatota archaeon]|nr:glycosyltransferase [Candidatus Thermoplasmatota archaeon]
MADGDGPVLATVVPVYNEAAHVEACLLSLLNQTLEPQRHMVVVLDGGSTDGTGAMVSSIIEA